MKTKQTLTPILVIEDSPEDFEVLVRGFKKAEVALPLYHCKNGQEALDFLYNRGAYAGDSYPLKPALILLDLNMPGVDGFAVLESLKENKDMKSIPIIVLSTSSNQDDINKSYACNVNSYIQKPENLEGYADMAVTLKQYWLGLCNLPQ